MGRMGGPGKVGILSVMGQAMDWTRPKMVGASRVECLVASFGSV